MGHKKEALRGLCTVCAAVGLSALLSGHCVLFGLSGSCQAVTLGPDSDGTPRLSDSAVRLSDTCCQTIRESAVSAVRLSGTVRRCPGFAVRLSDQGSAAMLEKELVNIEAAALRGLRRPRGTSLHLPPGPARGVAYAFSHSFIYTLVNTSHRHRAHKYATSGLKCQKAKEMWNAVRKERRKCEGGCRGWGRASSRLSSAEGREEGVGRCIVKNKTAAVRAM